MIYDACVSVCACVGVEKCLLGRMGTGDENKKKESCFLKCEKRMWMNVMHAYKKIKRKINFLKRLDVYACEWKRGKENESGVGS